MIRMERIGSVRFLLAYALLAGLFSLLAPVETRAQGKLIPPAPPAPSFKTLDQLEPRIPVDAAHLSSSATSLFVIDKPGSYYLTGNILGQATKNGIEITTGTVTLDLMGFTLQGVPGSLSGIKGPLVITGGYVIRNGQVANWGGGGVDAPAYDNGVIDGIVARANGGYGIRVGVAATVIHCSADSNVGIGISANDSSTVANCAANGNSGGGVQGDAGSSIHNCAARGNSVFGIKTGVGSHIESCAADNNNGLNTDGIVAGILSSIINCAVRISGRDGIVIGNSGLVRNCTSSDSSTANGIKAGNDCSLIDNVCNSNEIDGIVAGSNNFIRGNKCSANTGDGIQVSGAGNRIEGNHCSGHTEVGATAIRIAVAGNFAMQNSMADNTAAITSSGASIIGPSATSTADPDFTHPWANFTQ